MVPACGGDVSGTWNYDSECPSAATWCTVLNPSYTATATFNADKTFTLTQSCDGDDPSECNCAVKNTPGTQTGTYDYAGCSMALNLQGGGVIALGVRVQGKNLILSFANDRHFTTFVKP